MKSDQFKLVKFDNLRLDGQSAIEGYSAVLDADGVHVALVAPTLEILDDVWQRFHIRPVDKEKAQKVLIFKAPK